MRIIGIDSVERLLTENTGLVVKMLPVYTVYTSYFQSITTVYSVLTTTFKSCHLTFGQSQSWMIFHDILNSSFSLVTQTCNASALDFRPHGRRISGTEMAKRPSMRTKQPAHIRMQDDAGGIVNSGEILRPIHLSRPATLQRWSLYFRTRIAKWGTYIDTSWFNWVSPPAACPRVLTHPTVSVQRLIVPSFAIARSCPRRQSGCCVRIPVLRRRPPVRHPPPSAPSCRKHDIAWLCGLLVLAHVLVLPICQQHVFGCAFGCVV